MPAHDRVVSNCAVARFDDKQTRYYTPLLYQVCVQLR